MTDHVRVLLIDDDQEDFLLVADMLAEAENTKFKLTWAQTYEAGWRQFARESTTYIYLIILWVPITVLIF